MRSLLKLRAFFFTVKQAFKAALLTVALLTAQLISLPVHHLDIVWKLKKNSKLRTDNVEECVKVLSCEKNKTFLDVAFIPSLIPFFKGITLKKDCDQNVCDCHCLKFCFGLKFLFVSTM